MTSTEKIIFIHYKVGMFIPSDTKESIIDFYYNSIMDNLNNKKIKERFNKLTEIFGDEFR